MLTYIPLRQMKNADDSLCRVMPMVCRHRCVSVVTLRSTYDKNAKCREMERQISERSREIVERRKELGVMDSGLCFDVTNVTYRIDNEKIWQNRASYTFSYIYLPSMIYHFEHNTTLVGSLRRKWRKSGQYTVRVTSTGVVSVMRMPLHRDMRTEAQLKCRGRFVEAQRLMLEALRDKKRLRYFQKRQHRMGYKTLRGCMLAYYMDERIRRERREQIEEIGEKMRRLTSEVMVNTEGEMFVEQALGDRNAEIGNWRGETEDWSEDIGRWEEKIRREMG